MIEYRTVRASTGVNEDGHLTGRAAPFNSETRIGGEEWGFWEKINPSFFRKSVNDGDIVLLDNHDTGKPLARQSAGTLTLKESNGGLDWDAKVSDTTYGRDAVTNARDGNYGGCSFGFRVIKEKWTDDDGNPADALSGTHRELIEGATHEISTCTFPAYGDTSVTARAYDSEALLEQRRVAFEARGPKPYSDVDYADPKNGKYPVDTKRHVLAAWSYINQAKNAAKYPFNGVTLSSVKAKIRAAAKKFGIKIGSEQKAAEYCWLLREAFRDDLADAYDDDFYELDEEPADDPSDDESGSEPGEAPTRSTDDEQFALRAKFLMDQHALAAADLAIPSQRETE